MVAVDTFRDAGFDVLEAANVLEAVGLLAAHDEIAVVFTDVDLPGSLSGINLATLVSRIKPRTRIFVTSGMLDHENVATELGAVFIPKPYSLDEMTDLICNCLASPEKALAG
ncbi:MAG: response regulator [Rhizobiaceae bacterium]|nr:response regulator [Rhizobiaceae bacterium]